MQKKFCQYCGASLEGSPGARFCPYCGKRIAGDDAPGGRDRLSGGRQDRERYEVAEFRNASFEQVDRWFQETDATIISYTGKLYCREGLLKDEWFFSYLKIKYYPRPADYRQNWCYVSRSDFFVDAAKKRCDTEILRYMKRDNGELIGSPVYSEYHYSGGNGAMVGCEFVFYKS